jgi:hypothetical protein
MQANVAAMAPIATAPERKITPGFFILSPV